MIAATRETLTTFWLGDQLLALPASEIREVIQNPTVTVVPLVPPVVRGVFNARGELVTVLDLRRRLGLPEAAARSCTHVLIPTADGTASLLVDRQGDVMEVERATFEAPPAGIAEVARDCVVGAYKLPGRLLVVLDRTKLLDLAAFEDDGSEGKARKEVAL